MTTDERYRRMDAARVRAELTVQEVWLRYLALGGSGDAFDVDGYLQGLATLEIFQQDVLAQALNEALEDCFRAYRIPLTTPSPGLSRQRLGRVVDVLLDGGPAALRAESDPPSSGPA